MKGYFESVPRSEAESLAKHIATFADTLDKLGQTTRRNVDSLTELTGVAQSLLTTVQTFVDGGQKTLKDLSHEVSTQNKESLDAIRTDLARVAGKIRPQRVLSLQEQLVFLGFNAIVAIVASGGIIVAFLLLRGR